MLKIPTRQNVNFVNRREGNFERRVSAYQVAVAGEVSFNEAF